MTTTTERELRDTDYAKEIQTTEVGAIRLERIYVKEEMQEEIRLSWWPEGRMANRPVDIPESTLIHILAKGVREGVLSATFLPRLIAKSAEE